MSPITTHVLDTAKGQPARALPITLFRKMGEQWSKLAGGVTNDDGRIADLMEPGTLEPGDYRMVFDTGAYFRAASLESFYPVVQVEFSIASASQHYHVPLLLSPFGYSTYRGS